MIILSYDPALELIALACFAAYVMFSFCDGLGLKTTRKIIWTVYFLLFCLLSFWATGMFDLRMIVALSSLMAYALALFQKIENRKNRK